MWDRAHIQPTGTLGHSTHIQWVYATLHKPVEGSACSLVDPKSRNRFAVAVVVTFELWSLGQGSIQQPNAEVAPNS